MKHYCESNIVLYVRDHVIFLLNFDIIVTSPLPLPTSLISKKVNCYDKYVQKYNINTNFDKRILKTSIIFRTGKCPILA